MHTVTLLARAYDDYQLNQVSRDLKSTFEDLKVEIQIGRTTARGWIQASVSGEDENVVLNYLTANIGLCPASLDNLTKYQTIEGRLTDPSRHENELQIDIGVFSPRIVDASITLKRLQAQLGEGKKIPLRKFNELFGFCKNLPLTIKILNADNEKNHVEAELAEKQQKRYDDWKKSLLDRLLILGASHREIKLALENSGFSRYVIGIEPLGIFEHAIVCKLGTDAAGLIPRIGRKLGKATFSVFRPRRVLGFLTQSQTVPTS
jgi:hypothetical protein